MARAKNAGPLLTSITKGQFEALPADLRASLTVTRTDQKVNLDDTGTALSSTVLESDIIASQTNERKETTVTVSGLPVTLSSKGWTGDFGGGATTITKVYEHNSTVTPAGSLTITDHSVTALWNGVSVEEKQELTAASWPVILGQELDMRTGFLQPYSEQTIAEGSELGTALTNIDPYDEHKARKRTYTAPNDTTLATFYQVAPGTMDLRLPDVLTSIDVVFNESVANGSYSEYGDGIAAGTSPALSMGFRGSGQGSGSIQPDLVLKIKQGFRPNVPCFNVVLFLASGKTTAYLLTQLSTILGASVSSWPRFRPEQLTLTLFGMTRSVSVDANVQQSVMSSAANSSLTYSAGNGFRQEAGVSVRTFTIPPVIHAAFDFRITGVKTSQTFTVAAAAAWPDKPNWPARSAGAAYPFAVSSRIMPEMVDATENFSAIPTSGYYLESAAAESHSPGVLRLFCRVVNFAAI